MLFRLSNQAIDTYPLLSSQSLKGISITLLYPREEEGGGGGSSHKIFISSVMTKISKADLFI